MESLAEMALALYALQTPYKSNDYSSPCSANITIIRSAHSESIASIHDVDNTSPRDSPRTINFKLHSIESDSICIWLTAGPASSVTGNHNIYQLFLRAVIEDQLFPARCTKKPQWREFVVGVQNTVFSVT